MVRIFLMAAVVGYRDGMLVMRLSGGRMIGSGRLPSRQNGIRNACYT